MSVLQGDEGLVLGIDKVGIQGVDRADGGVRKVDIVLDDANGTLLCQLQCPIRCSVGEEDVLEVSTKCCLELSLCGRQLGIDDLFGERTQGIVEGRVEADTQGVIVF